MLILRSPAKINLNLRILGKRGDGYHELSTLMQTVSLYDTIELETSASDRFVCSDTSLPMDQSNLVLRARDLFREKTGIADPVSIRLDKEIPHQAGLGGGSGNAATALWGLNQLFGEPATAQVLMEWSSEIGSDVPFFFSAGRALCTGRGEIVHPTPLSEKEPVWIVKPEIGLSTPAVYGGLAGTEFPTAEALTDLYVNDLEPAAFALCPELKTLKERLQGVGYETVLLCGSGTSFFCLGEAQPPEIPGARQYRAYFTTRRADSWY